MCPSSFGLHFPTHSLSRPRVSRRRWSPHRDAEGTSVAVLALALAVPLRFLPSSSPRTRGSTRGGAASDPGVSSRSRFTSRRTPTRLGPRCVDWLVTFAGTRALTHQVNVLGVPHAVRAN